MASWKKIITSGSNADLNQITASIIRAKDIVVTGSGTITADNFALGVNGNAIPVSAGGTGAKTAADGRANLGIAFSVSQSVKDVAGLTPSDGGFIVGDGSNFVVESGATVRTSLGLGNSSTQNSGSMVVSQSDSVDGGTVTNITGTSSFAEIQLSAGGTVSAPFFKGDGSGLTNVSTVSSLGDLEDVDFSSANSASGQILIVSGSGTSTKFIGATPTGDITLSTDDTATFSIATDVVGSSELGVSAGTVSESRAVVVDANKDIAGFRDVTGTRSASFASVKTTGGMLAGTGLKVEGTMFNAQDGRPVGLHVENDVSASGFVGEFFDITSSVVFTSASTDFGDSDGDVHTFHGDIRVGTGSNSLGPNDTNYPSYASGADSVFGTLGIHDVSGSLGQNVDLRSAFGGVSGSFAGIFRGDGNALDLSNNNTIGNKMFSTMSVVDSSGTETEIGASTNADEFIFSGSNGVSLSASSSKAIIIGLSDIPNASLENSSISLLGNTINLGDSDIARDTLFNGKEIVSESGIATGTSQGQLKFNGTDKSVNGLSTTSTVTFATMSLSGPGALKGVGVFSGSETGTSQGQIKLNGTDVDINGLSTTSEPTFASMSLNPGGLKGVGAISSSAITNKNSTQGTITLTNNGVATDLALTELGTTGNPTFANLTVSNLTVNGTSTVMDVQTVRVDDNFILLNSGSDSDTAVDSGITVKETDSQFESMYWDFQAQRWSINSGTTEIAGGAAITPNQFVMTVSSSVTPPDVANEATPEYGSDNSTRKGQVAIDDSGDVWIYT